MTCKIEQVVIREDLVVLRVSGRIDGEHVDTLRKLIAQQKAELRSISRKSYSQIAKL